MFGATEHTSRSVARAAAAIERLRAWLGETPAVVLTTPAAVAWAGGGVSPPIDRTAGVDLIWLVVSSTNAALITTQIEGPRVEQEYDPAAHGFSASISVPWWEPEAFVKAAEDFAEARAASLASDGHPAFGLDASSELIALRLVLSEPERDDLSSLGADSADALQTALQGWKPGQRDLDVQARVAAELESRGADAPVLIVGGDDRMLDFRHPMATGAQMDRIVMAVVVSRRGGLHAAATRFASAGDPGEELKQARTSTLRIDREVLSVCRPPSSYGQVVEALADAYAREGAPGAWTQHYQGGPIGFAQREFEIAPGQTGSPWYKQAVEVGHAVAWNPSLPGGAKVEDTYLITDTGLERVTDAPGWPLEPSDELVPARPAILDVSA
jgi:Xaa-Pro dipeptidase